jgi:hypothetical protein
MAKYAVLDAYVELATTDMSDHVESVQLVVAVAELETTAMGETWASMIAGLKSWSVQINWHQDHAASDVDATIWPALGTIIALEVRPTSGAVSATNPSFTGNMLIAGDYSPVSGSVGDLAKTSVTWKGTGALTRATS